MIPVSMLYIVNCVSSLGNRNELPEQKATSGANDTDDDKPWNGHVSEPLNEALHHGKSMDSVDLREKG